jgi:hypothetical protein
MNLDDRRREAAEAAVGQNYDFGDLTIENIDWTIYSYRTEDNERTAKVYYEDAENGGNIVGHATVRFEEGTDEIIEVYAMLDGEYVGSYNDPGKPAPGF